jgi:hypothetical protein
MMEQGMVFVTVTRRLSGSHGLGIMLGELPCAQGDYDQQITGTGFMSCSAS